MSAEFEMGRSRILRWGAAMAAMLALFLVIEFQYHRTWLSPESDPPRLSTQETLRVSPDLAPFRSKER